MIFRSALFIGILAGGPAAIWCVQTFPSRTIASSYLVKVVVYSDIYFHDHYCCSPGGNLLRPPPQRINLHLGSRERRPKVRAFCWLCCCLVVYHCLDDIRSRKLPSKSFYISLHESSGRMPTKRTVDNCQLPRVSSCGVRGRFSGRYWVGEH